MSTAPVRTRSLRKPADPGSRYGRPSTAAVDSTEKNAVNQSAAGVQTRNSQSPSRLPVKPTTRSTSTISRPPSSSSSISNKPLMRPPSSSSSRTKPAADSLQRRPSTTSSTSQPSNTEPVKKDRSRPPLVQSRHLRNASTSTISSKHTTRAQGHARNKSSSTLLTASTALRPPTRELADQPTSTRTSRAESLPKRPAFSTLQHHFSPAKNLAPKPHPAAFLAPPSPSKLPSNIAISAETAKLQNELLQLHILHKDAAVIANEWRASAKKKLGASFHEVVRRNDMLVQSEVDETAKVNAVALKKWQEDSTPGWGLEERIQILDEVVTGVWNMGEPGGKHARLVRKFERWLSRCQGTLAARERDDGVGDDDMIFLEELDKSWKDECLNLGRRLESWRDHLEQLGSLENGSSLATMVDNCWKLIKGMLMELSVMAQIERDAMQREVDWTRSMNDDISDEEDGRPVAGACWRTE
ncbi:Uncharacterized protein BP5553_00695 [Venustampulla echinocandica]|uniref:AGA1 A-agglutinin anchor subunit n=1 Tax=Venustampulla echinocandica TaxID=2656787 RepID=A0A370TYV7_9HELO|nr:Uncharacterized protein BP5553_00695 [Venustampulla echinocandica]RDL40716.1 Uncharacterized protein BP5553_00695 [Venustampulla echinocandica]